MRQEDEAGAVVADGRQLEAERLRAEEDVRHLDQQARAVARVGFAAAGAAVLEIDEQFETLLDDRVRRFPFRWTTKPTPHESFSC